MTHLEMTQLLAVANATQPGMTIAPGMAVIWLELLDGISYEDARAAVITHGRNETRFLTAADVVRIVRDKRNAQASQWSSQPALPPTRHTEPGEDYKAARAALKALLALPRGQRPDRLNTLLPKMPEINP